MSYTGCYYKLLWTFVFLLSGALTTGLALGGIWLFVATNMEHNPSTSYPIVVAFSPLDWICSLFIGIFVGLFVAFSAVHEEQSKQGRGGYQKKTTITAESPDKTNIEETGEYW